MAEKEKNSLDMSRRRVLRTPLVGAGTGLIGGMALSGSSLPVAMGAETIESSVLDGEPSYTPGIDKGFHVWRDNGRIHVAWTGDSATEENDPDSPLPGYAVNFNITVEGGAKFSGLSTSGFGSFGGYDSAEISNEGTTIEGKGAVGRGVDEISFNIDEEDANGSFEVTFNLEIGLITESQDEEWRSLPDSEKEDNAEKTSTSGDSDLVFLGEESQQPSSVPFTVQFGGGEEFDIEVLEGKPSYQKGGDLGFYVWQENGSINVIWTGDSRNTNPIYLPVYAVDINISVQNGEFENIRNKRFGDIVDNVELSDDKKEITGESSVSTGDDGFVFDVNNDSDKVTEVTFDLQIGLTYNKDDWSNLSDSEKEDAVNIEDAVRQPDLVDLGNNPTKSPGNIPFTILFGESTEDSAEREIAEKFAPDFYFADAEEYFPTDPTQFDDAINRVNDKRDDLGGYEDFGEPGLVFGDRYEPTEVESDTPFTELYGPDALSEYVNSDKEKTVFYNVVEQVYGIEELNVVSYWQYYAFDQYANVHWHDWEAMHIFFEGDIENTEDTVPLTAVGTAHRNLAPNNQYDGLDDLGYDRIGVLPELGAHANATDIDLNEEFDRSVDVTDSDGVIYDDAYGLPRDELADVGVGELATDSSFYQPTINGVPLQQLDLYDPDKPVSDEDVIDPDNPQEREKGEKLLYESGYELAPMQRVSEAIDEFTGPRFDSKAVSTFVGRSAQPSIFFAGEVGDLVSEILMSEAFKAVGEPWKEPDFDDEILKVLEDTSFVEDRYNIALDLVMREVRGVTSELETGPSGTIPEDQFPNLSEEELEELTEDVNIIRAPPSEESMVGVASEPRVGPTSNGRLSIKDLEEGEHGLIVNSPNRAPHVQRVDVAEGEETLAGVDGNISMTPVDDAVVIAGEFSDDTLITNVTVSEDYLGPVYDARPVGDSRFVVSIHYEGSYTVEITTEDSGEAVYRVDPKKPGASILGDPRTGKLPITSYLVGFLRDSADEAEELVDGGISNSTSSKFRRTADTAERAEERVSLDTADKADYQLATLQNQLDSIKNELDAQKGRQIGEVAYSVLMKRVNIASDEVDRALDAEANGAKVVETEDISAPDESKCEGGISEDEQENEDENENENNRFYEYTYVYEYSYTYGDYEYKYTYEYDWRGEDNPDPQPSPSPPGAEGYCASSSDLDPDPDPGPNPDPSGNSAYKIGGGSNNGGNNSNNGRGRGN